MNRIDCWLYETEYCEIGVSALVCEEPWGRLYAAKICNSVVAVDLYIRSL